VAAAGLMTEGRDPMAEMQRVRNALTFEQVWLQFQAIKRPNRNWTSIIGRHALSPFPLRAIHISSAEITAMLEPLWEKSHPTAERLRS